MEELKQKIEDIGVVYERFGHTPIASRVFAYLLLANPPYKSFDEIREFLGASKSAICNAINSHLQTGVIKYRTFSGDRKRYFHIDFEHWQSRVENSAKNLFELNKELEGALTYRNEMTTGDFEGQLEEIVLFQDFITKKIEEAIIEWRNR